MPKIAFENSSELQDFLNKSDVHPTVGTLGGRYFTKENNETITMNDIVYTFQQLVEQFPAKGIDEPIRKLFWPSFRDYFGLFCDFISRVIWAHITLEMKSQKRLKRTQKSVQNNLRIGSSNTKDFTVLDRGFLVKLIQQSLKEREIKNTIEQNK